MHFACLVFLDFDFVKFLNPDSFPDFTDLCLSEKEQKQILTDGILRYKQLYGYYPKTTCKSGPFECIVCSARCFVLHSTMGYLNKNKETKPTTTTALKTIP